MSNKLCRYFPTHPYCGAVICYGFVQEDMVVVNQCSRVEECIKRVFKDEERVMLRRLNKARKTRERIQELDARCIKDRSEDNASI